MAQVTSALASLLPLVGAVALTVQGVRRRMRADRKPGSAPPQPIENPPPVPMPRRQSAPDGTCQSCGTAFPARMTHCAVCERASASAGNSILTTAMHWLVFLAVMTAIIGGGWLVSP